MYGVPCCRHVAQIVRYQAADITISFQPNNDMSELLLFVHAGFWRLFCNGRPIEFSFAHCLNAVHKGNIGLVQSFSQFIPFGMCN